MNNALAQAIAALARADRRLKNFTEAARVASLNGAPDVWELICAQQQAAVVREEAIQTLIKLGGN